MLPDKIYWVEKRKESSYIPKEFLLSCNPSHLSNEEETLRLLSEVIDPYIKERRKNLIYPMNKNAFCFGMHSGLKSAQLHYVN